MVTLNEATGVYDEARAWYEGAWKSSNKTYPSLGPDHERNRNAREVERYIPALRGLLNGMSYEGAGAWLYEHYINFGNCGEMSALAAHLVRKNFPPANVFVVSFLRPASHTFISVNAAPAGANAMTFSPNGAIIIDVWLGICCEPQRYLSLANAKLNRWSEKRKTIAHAHIRHVMPNSQFYTNMLFNCGFRSKDTRYARIDASEN